MNPDPPQDAEEVQEPPAEVAPESREEAEGRPEFRPFHVVGIGASAGGLEALSELLQHLPTEGMAYVVVQHLAPHHESILPQLLARTTSLGVVTAAEGMTAEPGRVYVIPPNTDIALLHGVLRLVPPPSDGRPRLPIDFFLRSLADDVGASAIGIILSGAGSDGTLGVRAIKEGGGIAFAQDPSTARYDGMPRSALSSGSVDFCLTPRAIGEELAHIIHHRSARRIPRVLPRVPHVQEQLARLFLLVRSAFGTDLSSYKPSTVERRIDRRMVLHHIGNLEEYVKRVQSDPTELQALHRDMLITVTSFFRDQEPFEMLRWRVFPEIMEEKDPRVPVRVWVPACATGEEAYSIAIALLEYVGEHGGDRRVQIFGTDVDEESIRHARRGGYPLNIQMDVSPDRLSRFFVKKDSEYYVSRAVRDAVVFSKHNMLKDAAFSRMDLISCRNLLIYLQPSAQKRMLGILHYALNPAGYLLLGSSETVGDAPELFSLMDRKTRIYCKRHTGEIPTMGEILPGSFGRVFPPLTMRPLSSLQTIADRKIIEAYGPPGVLINENLDILHFRGQTGQYLDPTPGAASFNILRLARPELHMELRRKIQEAFQTDGRVTSDVSYNEEGKPGAVRLDLLPVQEPDTKTRCLLVSFIRLDPPADPLPDLPPGSETDERSLGLSRRIHDLERELEATRDYLQSTIEDKESANEELKSSNEELQAANEELQSTNEELETAQEEMQSTNEELTTLNDELQTRMSELGQSNDDLHNVLSGVENAVVIVGMDFRIRRYTASAERLFSLVPGDIGRPVAYLDRFCGPDMVQRVSGVIESLVISEEELFCQNQRWYQLRISPYRTQDHSIRGAVLTFVDIDVRKRADSRSHDVGEYTGKFLADIHHPLVILDGKLRVVWANGAYFERLQVGPEETIGHVLASDGDSIWASEELRQKLQQTIQRGKVLRKLEVEEPGGGKVRVSASLLPLASQSPMILVAIEDK